MGLNVNTYGVKNAVELCLRARTCRWCTCPPPSSPATAAGWCSRTRRSSATSPARTSWTDATSRSSRSSTDCEKLVARLREQADDKALTSTFREKALERLEEEGRDANDEKTLRLAVGRERKLWLTTELIEAGMERAAHWGWPNTYTYTKSLGEQVIAGTPDLRYAIVRPSIVESALRYPFPGWNEGFTTSAPLAFAGHQGSARASPPASRPSSTSSRWTWWPAR